MEKNEVDGDQQEEERRSRHLTGKISALTAFIRKIAALMLFSRTFSGVNRVEPKKTALTRQIAGLTTFNRKVAAFTAFNMKKIGVNGVYSER